MPVVVFLDRGGAVAELALSGERETYLSFHYLWFVIPEPHYSIYRDSDNIVARICLPQMRWEGQDEKIDAYARAVSGVLTLETDPRRREKYLDYVDTYAKLDEAERKLFERRYPREGEKMVGVVSRARDEGRDEGRQEGRQEGEAQLFLWQLEDKFGASAEQRYRRQVEQADELAIKRWSLRILKAETAEEVFSDD